MVFLFARTKLNDAMDPFQFYLKCNLKNVFIALVLHLLPNTTEQVQNGVPNCL